MVMKEKDEELALFLEVRRREKEKERNSHILVHNSNELDSPSLGSNHGGSPISKIVTSMPTTRKTAADNFLNSENEKSDYDWLLTPPGTPLFPSLEMESQKTVMSQIGVPNARPTALKSRLTNIPAEPASRSNVPSKHGTFAAGMNSSFVNRRTPSSGGPTSAPRSATPTGRPTLNTATKSSRPSTPTSRATLPLTKSAALPSSKPAAPPVRSSTPTRSTARSSTPTARPSMPASKSTSRSATPTRQSSTPLSAPSVVAAHSRPSVTKSVPSTVKNPVPSRGSSPTAKPRPWKPSEMPGFSLDAPPNLRTSLPERPASASRGRPGAPSPRSSSVEAGPNGRPRRQSCSPSRGRIPSANVHGNGSSVLAKNRARSNGNDNDNVSPVLIGTKMVERVVNMRKLAPPKHDDHQSAYRNSGGKSFSSLDSSGFGRTLSKKSLDMALRHMDIRRSVSGNLRPLMTNIPASSMYSVRSGSTRSRTVSVTDSPLATSSNASSEPSVNNISIFVDGSEMDDNDFGSERGNCSPTSQHGR